MAQKVVKKINWQNIPATETPINEDNLNQMDSELDAIDDRVVALMGYEERVEEAATETENNALDSKSWAVGGTGIRENENTDNSKYYSERARSYSQNASAAMESAEHWAGIAQELPQTLIESVESNTEAIRSLETENEEQDKKIDLQNVHFATGTSLQLETAQGGVRIDKIEGVTVKWSQIANNASKTSEVNGITFTKTDKTITFVGTATGNADCDELVGGWFYIDIPKGTKLLVRCAEGGSNSTYRRAFAFRESDGTVKEIYITGNEDIILEAEKDYNRILTKIRVFSGANVNKTIRSAQIFNLTQIFGVGNEPQTVAEFNLWMEENSLDINSWYPYEPYGIHTSGRMGLVDLASLSWETASSYKKALLSTAKKPSSNDEEANLFSNYNTVARNKANNTNDICLDTSGYLFVRTTETPSGKLAYELADGATPSQYAEVVKEHGKNLTKGFTTYSVNSSTGARTVTQSGTDFIEIKQNTNYSISNVPTAYNTYISYYSETQSYLSRSGLSKTETINITTPQDAKYLVISNQGDLADTSVYNLQLEEGTEATAYAPYESKTVFIPTSNPLAEGDSISEKGEYHEKSVVKINSINFTLQSGVFFSGSLTDRKIVINQEDIIDIEGYEFGGNYPSLASARDSMPDKSYGLNNNGTSYNIFIKDSAYASVETFLAENGNKKIVYELATPTLTPLTNEQKIALNSLESFDGQTNITTADKLAEIKVGYGKSDTVATALLADNQSKINEAQIEQNEHFTVNELVAGLKVIKDGHRVTVTTQDNVQYATLKSLTLANIPISLFNGIAWITSGASRYIGRCAIHPTGKIVVNYTNGFGGSYTECADTDNVQITASYYTND